jgi:hypothetical protein
MQGKTRSKVGRSFLIVYRFPFRRLWIARTAAGNGHSVSDCCKETFAFGGLSGFVRRKVAVDAVERWYS